jgi:hypothetical protein
MARITAMERRDGERNNILDVGPATYKVFEKEGARYFQIDTYKKDDRECQGTVKQKIQFDKAFAKRLIALLRECFQL